MSRRLPPVLVRKIRGKSARVGIIGLGYVGLPLAVEFAKQGYRVVGIDVDEARVGTLNRGRSYISDVPQREISSLVVQGRLKATTRYEVLGTLDGVMICVPTPLRKTREPDISYIVAAAEQLAKHLHRYQVIVLESTTYPGTTNEVILPMLEKTGLKVGTDFFLGFSPERIDPGNTQYDTASIPKVVSGITPACRQVIQLLYAHVIRQVIPVSSTKVAEMVKLLENTFRSVNIGLVNELALMCHRFGVDVWEVIEAAKTKPFGFMPFYPGPGLGGHCLDGKESVTVRHQEKVEVLSLEELMARLRSEGTAKVVHRKEATFIRPNHLEILSFDANTRQTSFKPLQWLSVRPYSGAMVNVRTKDGRTLVVTDLHPMVVENGTVGLKVAKDLVPGDALPIVGSLPNAVSSEGSLDLIESFRALPEGELRRIRVEASGFSWKSLRPWLRPVLEKYRKDPWEYYRINQIPLLAYLEATRQPGFPDLGHWQLQLCTGRGPSRSTMPAVIRLDPAFCRLIGYYLSEGCLTQDNAALRVRFSFHSKERELIEDVKTLLAGLGLRCSEHKLKRWKTWHIKVSSRPFGLLIRDILRCGINSYTMRIPSQLFSLSRDHRDGLLSGILRGDAGVDSVSGHNTYRKRGKQYCHRFHTASMNYFSISPILFQQVVLLLQDFSVVPTFKKNRKFLLTVFGEKQLRRCANWLAGEKRQKLLRYLEGRVKPMPNRTFTRHSDYVTVPVKQVRSHNGRHQVYSVEVEETHTFVTSYGIVVHNCIPLDPLYLSWKAKSLGFEPRFIELSSQVNAAMPEYVVERVQDALNEKGKALKGSRILILGVAYKRGVSDTRESPALEIIHQLQREGAHVRYHDPFVPRLSMDSEKESLRSVALSSAALRQADCTVIVTDHPGVDYESVMRHARLILDTRNVLRRLKNRSRKVVRI